MKKLIYLFLLLLLLCGCSKNKDDIQTPVNFYYPNTDISYDSLDAVLSAEIRDGSGYMNDLVKLLNLYLAGPLSNEFKSPFPTDTLAKSVFLADGMLTIELSAEFADLKGLDLTIACASLTKTAAALTECSRIRVYVSDTKLDGNSYITMDTSKLLLLDNVN